MKFKMGGSGGTSLITVSPGVMTNAYFGDRRRRGVYYRFESEEVWEPPYIWSGKIKTVSMKQPPIFEVPPHVGVEAWYRPSLVFHPMYGSSNTPARANDENVLIGIGGYNTPTKVGHSAELRAERPSQPYGARTGYVKRDLVRTKNNPFWDNKWHTFVIHVHSHAHYSLTWDGVLVADIVEKAPSTMSGANGVGLRCDFADIEIKDFKVTGPRPPFNIPNGIENNMTIHKPFRVYDSRKEGIVIRNNVREIDVPGNKSVFAHITCVNNRGYNTDGHLSVTGYNDGDWSTSLVNWNAGDKVSTDGAPIAVPDGKLYVRPSGTTHVLVDIFEHEE